MSDVDELEAAAMRLPQAERARLAERLISSLEEDGEIERAWADEVRRRVDAIRAGKAELIPAEDVLAELKRAGR
jgi:putative addiction module component (TIGR02574 family)